MPSSFANFHMLTHLDYRNNFAIILFLLMNQHQKNLIFCIYYLIFFVLHFLFPYLKHLVSSQPYMRYKYFVELLFFLHHIPHKILE